METKKEFTAMDFLTFTVAGNVVVTDPVTGKEFLCFRQQDNTFIDSRDNQKLTPEQIYALVELRIEQAQKMDAEAEAKAAQEAANQQATPPPRFCAKCGSPIFAETKFCTKCGTPVENV